MACIGFVLYCVCNQVAPVAEEHVQCGAKKRNPTMGSKREKPNIKPDVQKSMEDCKVLESVSSPPHSVSSPPRIITRSRAALLKNDENDAMLVDSIRQ